MKTKSTTFSYLLATLFLVVILPHTISAQTYLRDPSFSQNDVTATEEVKCIVRLKYQTPSTNNGKTIIGGSFSVYDGIFRSGIARINADGTLDTTFTSPGFNAGVYCVAEGRDGKIYVGGNFTRVGGVTRGGIIRLNSNGTVDNTFNPGTGFSGFGGTSDPPAVWKILVKDDPVLDATDAGVVVGGAIKRFNGSLLNGSGDEGGLVQLNFNGTLNRSFRVNDDCCTAGGVYDMVFDANGQIVIVGEFGTIDGTTCRRVGRINRKGGFGSTPIRDATYGLNVFPQSTVYAVALQPDGKIIVGGAFTSFLNYSWSTISGSGQYIARLNANGTLDLPGDGNSPDFIISPGFTTPASVTHKGVKSLAIQADGKILVGGDLDSCDGTPVYNLVRLNVDGKLDNTFNIGTGFNNTVRAIEIQPVTYSIQSITTVDPGGHILVGGQFNSFNGSNRQTHFLRLGNSYVLAFTPLNFKASIDASNSAVLQWQDSGALFYELQRSTDGVRFHTIHTISNNGVAKTFSYTDKSFTGNTVYYRLSCKEADGNVRVSEVLRLLLHSTTSATLSTTSSSQIKVIYNSNNTAVKKLYIKSVTSDGRLVWQKEVPVTGKAFNVNVPVPMNITSGFLLLTDDQGTLLYKGYRLAN